MPFRCEPEPAVGSCNWTTGGISVKRGESWSCPVTAKDIRLASSESELFSSSRCPLFFEPTEVSNVTLDREVSMICLLSSECGGCSGFRQPSIRWKWYRFRGVIWRLLRPTVLDLTAPGPKLFWVPKGSVVLPTLLHSKVTSKKVTAQRSSLLSGSLWNRSLSRLCDRLSPLWTGATGFW